MGQPNYVIGCSSFIAQKIDKMFISVAFDDDNILYRVLPRPYQGML